MADVSFADPLSLLAIALAMAMGGVLKGATGAGAPILAVPLMTAIYDVRVAVAVMVIPSIVTNVAQARRYRADRVEPGFAGKMATAGAIGVALGSVLLVSLPVGALQLSMAVMIAAYVAMRLGRPDLKLELPQARRLVWPAGFLGGALQGAVGLSAPVSLTFLNAMRLPRPVFIFTVSVYFVTMSIAQLAVQGPLGIMTRELALLSLLAVLPLVAAMPLGEAIGRRFAPRTFDLAILGFLALLAVRLVWAELT